MVTSLTELAYFQNKPLPGSCRGFGGGLEFRDEEKAAHREGDGGAGEVDEAELAYRLRPHPLSATATDGKTCKFIMNLNFSVLKSSPTKFAKST